MSLNGIKKNLMPALNVIDVAKKQKIFFYSILAKKGKT